MSSNLMQTLFSAFALCFLLQARTVSSTWDFAITTKSKILFYDEHWQPITSSAHQFDQLSAITFDETEEIIYFNDRLHNNGSIFSLKLPNSSSSSSSSSDMQEDPHIIEKIVQRTMNESINGIAYDPLNRNIFWTDAHNRKIYFISIDAAANEKVQPQPKVLIDFASENSIPDGIAIDICRRKLYWTNSNFKNASIERIDLDGKQRELLVRTDLFMPHGIVVDQLSDRIYYVVDQQGIHFSVESTKFDGSDRRIVVRWVNNKPLNLAVTKDAIFWTDSTHNSVWSHSKILNSKIEETANADAEASMINGGDGDGDGDADGGDNSFVDHQQSSKLIEPKKVLSFAYEPRGIVARSRFLTTMEIDSHCSAVVRKIKSRLLAAGSKPKFELIDSKIEKLERDYCLNGGDYIKHSGTCICKIGFKGARCGTSECYNYCVHGTCSMSSMGFPKCTCQRGFYGERCQSYKCSRYCFNDGLCRIDSDGVPTCECKENFGGQRCEQNSTEICALFCRLLKHEPELNVPYGCHDICEELSQYGDGDGAALYAIPKYKHLELCDNGSFLQNSKVIMILVIGVVLSLCLVVAIVHGIRRIYKPARPRIRKTFVVRKQAAISSASDTPLTNRPIATEQCEITIENCCNMNICDTPCFDPKLVQQSLSKDNNTKDDKKMLIHNMEDELY